MIVCCLLFAICCLLFVVCYFLFPICCLLFVVAVCCLRFVFCFFVCCLLSLLLPLLLLLLTLSSLLVLGFGPVWCCCCCCCSGRCMILSQPLFPFGLRSFNQYVIRRFVSDFRGLLLIENDPRFPVLQPEPSCPHCCTILF